ncbi:hypothetical protein [Thalassobacillus devorans]|uniref:hypothetical protein n=1 Tax=Thalassobacillus devorans TaxID=279813 RepID=UPI00048B4186|nr:hypothetical protein [Thalassobacillus devorans]
MKKRQDFPEWNHPLKTDMYTQAESLNRSFNCLEKKVGDAIEDLYEKLDELIPSKYVESGVLDIKNELNSLREEVKQLKETITVNEHTKKEAECNVNQVSNYRRFQQMVKSAQTNTSSKKNNNIFPKRTRSPFYDHPRKPS